MRWLLLALLLVLLPGSAWAAAKSCAAGGSLATPLDWTDGANWGGVAPSTSDDVTISGTCIIQCPYAGTCNSSTTTVTSATARLILQEGSILVIADQDDFGDPDVATAGTVEFSGSVLWDTTVNGALWAASGLSSTNRALMIFQISAAATSTWTAAGATVPAAGDRILVTSGVGRGLWYEITAVNFSGCPVAGLTCQITFRLYDTGMAYANVAGAGTGVGGTTDTTNRPVGFWAGTGTIATATGERARVASPVDAAYSTATAPNGEPTPFDRCVDLCTTDGLSGWAGDCVTTDVVKEDGAYTGWILEFWANSTDGPGSPLATERHLITKSYNDIPCVTSACVTGSTVAGVVDRVCSDAPFGPTMVGITTTATLRNYALIPPIHSGVDFKIIKPAIARATGAENDTIFDISGSGAIVASDAFFDGFAQVRVNSSAQSTFNETLIVPDSVGQAAGAAQVACDKPSAIRVLNTHTGGYSMNYTAVEDSRNPYDNSANCCSDQAPQDGTCDAPGTPADAFPDDGSHGFNLEATAGSTLTNIACRYTGDMCFFQLDDTDTSLNINGLVAWQIGTGPSTAALAVDTSGTQDVNVSNLIAINAAGLNGGQLTLAGSGLTAHVNGVYSMQGLVTGGPYARSGVDATTVNTASTIANVVSVAADPTANTNVIAGGPHVTNVYGRNLGKLSGNGWITYSKVLARQMATPALTSFLGTRVAGTAAKFSDFIVTQTDAEGLEEGDPGSGATLEVVDGYIQLQTQGVLNAIGAFADGSVPLAGRGIDDVIAVYGRALRCTGATWGGTNGHLIGNLLGVAPGTADFIGSYATNCPAATSPIIISLQTMNAQFHPFGIGIPSNYGPANPVGVDPNSEILTRVFDGLQEPVYSEQPIGGSGGGGGSTLWGGWRWPEH